MRKLTLLALFALPSVASAVPMELTQQGRLFDSGGIALTSSHDITFTLFDDETAGTQLWTETVTLSFDNGYYTTLLGNDPSGNPLDDALFDNDLWLEMAVDSGSAVGPRYQLVSVPFARKAGGVDGGIVDATEIRVNGTTVIDSSGQISGASLPGGDGDTLAELGCATAGEIAQFDGLDWQCAPSASAHVHDATEVTSGVFDIARLPVGTSATDVAAGDHLHALSQLTGVIIDSQLPINMEAVAEAYITNGAIDLDAGTTIGGVAIQTGTDQVLTESDVETFVTNGAIDLDAGSTIGGQSIGDALVPSGLIGMFAGACPSGWTAYAALNGRMPRGEVTGDPTSLDTGGSDDAVLVSHGHTTTGNAASGGAHDHGYSGTTGNQSSNHSHGMDFNTASDGAHAHQLWSRNDDFNCTGDSSGNWGIARCPDHGGHTWPTSNAQVLSGGSNHAHRVNGNTGGVSANHNHGFSGTTTNTGAHAHSVTGSTSTDGVAGAGANVPAYAEVLFCTKD